MLNLQLRSESVAEIRHALRIAVRRVSMMAAVQNSLLTESNQKTVDAAELIGAICAQIDDQQSWAEDDRQIRPEVSPGRLPSDLAIPLAMFIQESVHLICPVSDNGTAIDYFRLCFAFEGPQARLRLTCGRKVKTGAGNLDDQSTSLFLAAFARQMGGSVAQRGPEPGITVIELLIPI